MNASQIIARLGEYRAVATALGKRPNTVHSWTRRGIAAKAWPEVLRMAQSVGADDITLDVLEKAEGVAPVPRGAQRARSLGDNAPARAA